MLNASNFESKEGGGDVKIFVLEKKWGKRGGRYQRTANGHFVGKGLAPTGV